MNNIDILEEKIKNVEKYDTYNYTWTEQDIQAISTLIAENKGLKEKYSRKLIDFQKEREEYEKDYIPKSKVEELQNKYKSKIEKLESKKIWNEPVDTINKNRYVNYYNAYEELLGEE